MTGHWPHGVPTSRDNPGDKWFIRALDNTPYLENRTYEAIGPHFQGNPYGLPDDVLVPHGAEVIEVVRTFRDIRDYEGLYQVSNLGNVRSLNWRNTGTVRNLALKSHNRGDLKVELANRGKCKTFMVHRLVALHFVPGYQDGFVVSHINERKQIIEQTTLNGCPKRKTQNIRYPNILLFLIGVVQIRVRSFN